MSKDKHITIITIIAVALAMVVSYLGWYNNQISQELKTIQNDYSIMFGELEITKENLQAEIANSIKLNDAYNNKIQELAEINQTIVDLKKDEYKLIYLGEFKLTAYCSCEVCCGQWAIDRELDENGNPIIYTASGNIAQVNHTIAVDPSVLPFGSEVYIPGYGIFVAEDSGYGVNGNHIDIYFESHEEAVSHGVAYKDVWLMVKKTS
jgi:3D (Asp-Asp-Asp) domain-containing protein